MPIPQLIGADTTFGKNGANRDSCGGAVGPAHVESEMRNYFGDFSWRHALFERVASLDGQRIGLATSYDSRERDHASVTLRQRGSLAGSL